MKFDNIEVKGEFVIVIHYGQKKMAVSSELEELAKKVMTKANDKNLSKLLSSITGEKAKSIYESLTKNRRN